MIIRSETKMTQQINNRATNYNRFNVFPAQADVQILKIHYAIVLIKIKSKLNQIFHYTRCNTPKRVTSWRGPSPRHCPRATQLLSLSQRWRAVGNAVSDLTGPRFEPLTSRSRDERVTARPSIWFCTDWSAKSLCLLVCSFCILLSSKAGHFFAAFSLVF